MGYAGYAPGNRVAEALSPMQQALQSLPFEVAQEILELLEKVTRNVVRNPTEEKFRCLKLTNAKIAAAVEQAPTMVTALQEMGWVVQGDTLILPPQVRLTHETHVIAIIDAKDYFKKEVENERRRQLRASKLDSEKEELIRQAEIDRQEKSADGPVTRSSVAQKMGDGPRVMRAGDIGIGKSSGGGG